MDEQHLSDSPFGAAAQAEILAKAASVTKNGRNEFIALSDSIGLSMQVLATSQPEPPGADSLMTHLFVRGSPHIEDDMAFGVRPSLIVDFVWHDPGLAPDGSKRDAPFHTLEYDLVLTRDGA